MNWYNDKIKTHKNYSSFGIISDVNFLYPPFAFLVLKLFARARKNNLNVCIYETYRSPERQLDLFNKGKTKLSKNGMHHFGVATDLVFIDEKNNPSWDQKYNWSTLGKIGKELGLFWGGDWGWDNPHFQLIPATPVDQIKIINGDYPIYDLQIESFLGDLLFLYESVRSFNYKEEYIKNLIVYLDKLESPKRENIEPPITIVTVPEITKEVQLISEETVETKNVWVLIFNFIMALFAKIFKK